MERRDINIRCESELAVRSEARRCVRNYRAKVNASCHSDVCMCDDHATGLEMARCLRGDISSPGRTCTCRLLGSPGVAHWGWCTLRGWRRLWGGSSARVRPRPLRCASALNTLWESVRRWSTRPPSSARAARARPAAPSTITGVFRGGECSPNT
jgi:hypothetical protein